jgi:broad specificity phosphatase PhoE
MSGFPPPRRLILIRHGHTLSIETGVPTRDDPLSVTGKAQAALLSVTCPHSFSEVTTVLVSPLRRALETALVVFGNRPDVTLYVHPLLREFNLNQKENDNFNLKYPRHVGSRKAELQAHFPASSYKCRVNWSELPEGDWWEPHGDAYKLSTIFPNKFPPPRDADDSTAAAAAAAAAPSCTDRCKQLLTVIHGGAFSCPGPLVLVAHENVFRIIAGIVFYYSGRALQSKIKAFLKPVG